MTGSVGDVLSGFYTQQMQSSASDAKTAALENKLTNRDMSEASDEEMMEACKEFEAYLVEQVMKQVEKSIPKSEEEKDNKYLDYFGDMMLQEYSSIIAEQGTLGIAQTLYEAMKNNMNTATIKTEES